MEKNGEVVTEVQENGYTKRYWLHEVHITGGTGYHPIGDQSVVKLFNCSTLMDSNGVIIGQPVKEPTVTITLAEYLVSRDMTKTELATWWADLMVPDEVA